MSLVLPGNIPVAADSLQSLSRIGSPRVLRTKATALVLITEDPSDPYSVWASPKLKDYRSVWDAAATAGFVDAATEWGGGYRSRFSQELGKLTRQQCEICTAVPGVG